MPLVSRFFDNAKIDYEWTADRPVLLAWSTEDSGAALPPLLAEWIAQNLGEQYRSVDTQLFHFPITGDGRRIRSASAIWICEVTLLKPSVPSAASRASLAMRLHLVDLVTADDERRGCEHAVASGAQDQPIGERMIAHGANGVGLFIAGAGFLVGGELQRRHQADALSFTDEVVISERAQDL